jgi:membrane protease YdiL (CAAX protease family)
MAKWDTNDPSTLDFIRGMQLIQFISLFVIPVFICAWLFSSNSRDYLGLRQPHHYGYYLAGIAVMLFALPFVNLLGELNRAIDFPNSWADWMKKKEDNAAKTIEALLSRQSLKDLFMNLFFIAVLAAVGEELLFRGIAQRLFIRIFKSPLAGIVVTAVLFSAMHVQFYGFLPRFTLGIVLGLLYWYSGSLWTAIIAHFVYDATLVVLAYLRPELIADESSIEMNNLAMVGAISFAIVVLILIWMKRRSRTVYPDVYANDNVPVKDHPF